MAHKTSGNMPKRGGKMWQTIKQLKGTTLKTLYHGNPFDILEVNDRGVIVRPQATGVERTIRRTEIEGAFNELVRRGEIARTDIRDRYSNFNPAYIAAMLAALPGVTTRLKPIRLYFKAP